MFSCRMAQSAARRFLLTTGAPDPKARGTECSDQEVKLLGTQPAAEAEHHRTGEHHGQSQDGQ